MLQRDTEELGGEAGATLAAGVFEAGGRRRDCGPSASITSTHLLPRPATSRLWPHASHTAPGSSCVGSNPSPPRLTPPDYSAAVNQYSQALGTGTPLELLLTVCSFTGVFGAHASQITWFSCGVFTRAHGVLQKLMLLGI